MPTGHATRPRLGGLLALLVAALLLAATPASAQSVLDCRGCAFTVTVTSWNGSAEPGGRIGGTFRIDNTGESADSYKVRIETGNESWPHDVEPDQTDDVPPGSGLFAEEGNHTNFTVTAVVPPGARAGARASFVVVVASQNMPEDDDGREQTVRLDARALQTHAWRLDCTPTAHVAKGDDTTLNVTVHNTGNGDDDAVLRVDADPRFSTSALPRSSLGPGASERHEIVVGASLRLDDGDHAFAWSLVRDDGATVASCESIVTVTGGTGDGTRDGTDDTGESPPLPPVPLIAVAGLGLLALRHHVSTRRQGP